MRSIILASILIFSLFSTASANNGDPNSRLRIALHNYVLKNTNGKKEYYQAKEQGLGILRFYCHNGTDAPEKVCQNSESFFLCPDNDADLCFNFSYHGTASYIDLMDIIIEGLEWYNN